MKRYYVFFAITLLVAIVASTSLYLLRGGPVADQLLADDIRNIANEVDYYYLNKNELPDNLSQVIYSTSELGARAATLEYHVLTKTETAGNKAQYELCATFKSKQSPGRGVIQYGTTPNPEYHDSGRQCFTYTELAAFKQ